MLVQEMFKEQIHYNHGTWSDISILPTIKMHVKIYLKNNNVDLLVILNDFTRSRKTGCNWDTADCADLWPHRQRQRPSCTHVSNTVSKSRFRYKQVLISI